MLHREHVLYCSSKLTTGLRLYQALRRYGFKSADELLKHMGDAWSNSNLRDVNTNAAIHLPRMCARGFKTEQLSLLRPYSPAPGWTQPEYLAFWEMLPRLLIAELSRCKWPTTRFTNLAPLHGETR